MKPPLLLRRTVQALLLACTCLAVYFTVDAYMHTFSSVALPRRMYQLGRDGSRGAGVQQLAAEQGAAAAAAADAAAAAAAATPSDEEGSTSSSGGSKQRGQAEAPPQQQLAVSEAKQRAGSSNSSAPEPAPPPAQQQADSGSGSSSGSSAAEPAPPPAEQQAGSSGGSSAAEPAPSPVQQQAGSSSNSSAAPPAPPPAQQQADSSSNSSAAEPAPPSAQQQAGSSGSSAAAPAPPPAQQQADSSSNSSAAAPAPPASQQQAGSSNSSAAAPAPRPAKGRPPGYDADPTADPSLAMAEAEPLATAEADVAAAAAAPSPRVAGQPPPAQAPAAAAPAPAPAAAAPPPPKAAEQPAPAQAPAPSASPCPDLPELPALGAPLPVYEAVVPDLSGRTELTLPDVARDVLAAERAGKGRKIIAMSVYGPNQRYWQGVIDNSIRAMRDWPGWTLRIYYGNDAPEHPLRLAAAMGAELVRIERTSNYVAGTFYRYFALEDRSATRIIFRDIDGRLTHRDKAAVKEWMETDHYFHTMQDHYFHLEPIMGGMWGTVAGFVNPLLIRRWKEEDGNGTRKYTQGADQDWLRTVIWPLVRNNTLNHSSFNCKRFGNESAEWRGFPSKRVGERDFVGNTRVPDNNFDGTLPYGVCPMECRRKGKEKEWPEC